VPAGHPIEPCWAKSITWLRQGKAWTVEGLRDALKHALDTVTVADMRGWFMHGGYSITVICKPL
jgi:hypothetical protein